MRARHRAFLALVFLSWGARTEAVPLLSGLGGPSGYGAPEHCLHPTDDGSYAGPSPDAAAAPVAIDLRPAFDTGLSLLGAPYASFYLNANGNITFVAPLAAKTPAALPIEGRPMIAPWWADVDTRPGGAGRNVICYHLQPGRLVVTWHDVGSFDGHVDRLNDFQLIVSTYATCSEWQPDIEFRYNRCEWTSGDASSGVGALAGFDAGNRRNYVALPMSRTDAIRDLCRLTNVPGGEPGLFRFQLRVSDLPAGACDGENQPCAPPDAAGACADGIYRCVEGDAGTRVARCAPRYPAREERCNGVDDDCDGATDEGADLCGDGARCEDGRCDPLCDAATPCEASRVCRDGACVDRACDVTQCAEGLRCLGGACLDPCTDVTCPRAQVCSLGRCVDPCEGVACPMQERCDPGPGAFAGQCTRGCFCAPCAAGFTCRPDGLCVEDACEGVTCGAGSRCVVGRCRDDCETATGARPCPEGESCRAGRCEVVRAPGRDAAADAPEAAVSRDVASDAAPTPGHVVPSCACSARNERAGARGTGLAALVGAAAWLRRRKRRSDRAALAADV